MFAAFKPWNETIETLYHNKIVKVKYQEKQACYKQRTYKTDDKPNIPKNIDSTQVNNWRVNKNGQ